MVKLHKFDVEFDSASGAYSDGDTVSGRVLLELTEPLESRGIRLKVIGKAEVQWTERKSGNRSYTYSAGEVYFEHIQILWGGGSIEKLPMGEHCFPFSCTLPQDLPSSFEGSYGHVRYYCKVKIERPWKFDATCKQPFTVNGILDLNKQMDAIKPVSDNKEKWLRCLFCRSGPISVVATTDRTGYVPGESVILNAEISNFSSDVLTKTRAELVADIIYHSTAKSRRETAEIAKVKQGQIKPGHTELWSGVPLLIPPVPPSFLDGCNIIDVHYSVRFVVVTPRPSFDLTMDLPIVIGTIPLSDDTSTYSQPPPSYVDALHSLLPTISQRLEQPPPTYLESVFGGNDIREHDDDDKTYGQLLYTPVYPYFTDSTS